MCGKNTTIYLAFRSTVAKRVAARQHCIAGHEVTVALNKPLQIYTNRLLFRNVPRGVSSDLLVKRLKQITGQEADEILYGDEFTVIIATFDEKPGRSDVLNKLSPCNC